MTLLEINNNYLYMEINYYHLYIGNKQKLYEKDLHDPDNHDGVITYLEIDILNMKSSGPLEASLQTKLVEVMEFQPMGLQRVGHD